MAHIILGANPNKKKTKQVPRTKLWLKVSILANIAQFIALIAIFLSK